MSVVLLLLLAAGGRSGADKAIRRGDVGRRLFPFRPVLAPKRG
jgi:hypothetical protein